MWTTLLQADNINRKEEKATTTIIKQKNEKENNCGLHVPRSYGCEIIKK